MEKLICFFAFIIRIEVCLMIYNFYYEVFLDFLGLFLRDEEVKNYSDDSGNKDYDG